MSLLSLVEQKGEFFLVAAQAKIDSFLKGKKFLWSTKGTQPLSEMCGRRER